MEVAAHRFYDNRHMKVINVSSLGSGHLYRQEIFLTIISVRGRVDPKIVVLPKRLCQLKIQMTPSEIELATFRLVEQ
jgi:hypothetical protein